MYHCNVKIISAKNNEGIIAKAAYNSGMLLENKKIDLVTGIKIIKKHDYRNKQGVVYSEIFGPKDIEINNKDRELLWQKVEEKDKREDSQYAKEIVIGLPKELTIEENIELIKEYIEDVFCSRGIVADVNYHNDNKKNPHAHILVTMRKIEKDKEGFKFGNKERSWNSKEVLKDIRASYAFYQNKHLLLNGVNKQVTDKSYKDLGIGVESTCKIGKGFYIKDSERIEYNKYVYQERAEKLIRNPALVLRLLELEKQSFTKRDIEKKIEEILKKGEKIVKEEVNTNVINTDLKDKKENHNDNNLKFTKEKEEILQGKILDKLISNEEVKEVKGANIFGKKYYISSKNEKLSKDLLDITKKLEDINFVRTKIKLGDFYIDRDKELSEEQRNAIEVLSNNSSIGVLRGKAVSGKTVMLKKICKIYKRSGTEVIALAPTAKVADDLMGIGCKYSKTVDSIQSLEKYIESSKRALSQEGMSISKIHRQIKLSGYKHPFSREQGRRKLVIVDEAAMLSKEKMLYLSKAALENKAKIIFVGDENQLSPVRALGGGFESILENVQEKVELKEVYRQKDEKDKEISRLLASYKISNAVEKISEKENMLNTIKGEGNLAILSMSSEFVRNYKENGVTDGRQVMLAHSRSDVRKINAITRESLKLLGYLRKGSNKQREYVSDEYLIDQKNIEDKIEFYIGDQIICKKNNKEIGVNNGERATVIGVSDNIIKIKNSKGEIKTINISEYEEIEYAYAMTIHSSQGSTVEKSYIYMKQNMGYRLSYVGLTRHREECKIYISESDFGEKQVKNKNYRNKEELILDNLTRAIGRVERDVPEAILANNGVNIDSLKQEVIIKYLNSNEACHNIRGKILKEKNYTNRKQLYTELKLKETEREARAKEIVANLESYMKYIKMSNINLDILNIQSKEENKVYGVYKGYNNYLLGSKVKIKDSQEIESFKDRLIAIRELCLNNSGVIEEKSLNSIQVHVSKILFQDAANKKELYALEKEKEVGLVKEKDSYKQDRRLSQKLEVMSLIIKGYYDKEESLNKILERYDAIKSTKRSEVIKNNPSIIGRVRGKEYKIGGFIKIRSKELKERMCEGENIYNSIKLYKELSILKSKQERVFEDLEDIQVIDRKLMILKTKMLGELDRVIIKELGSLINKNMNNRENQIRLSKYVSSDKITNYLSNRLLIEEKRLLVEENKAKELEFIKYNISEFVNKINSQDLVKIFNKIYEGNIYGLEKEIRIEKSTAKEELVCGSFRLQVSGEKKGLWYRFSRSEGGDLLLLSLMNKMQAMDIRSSFDYINEICNLNINKKNSIKKQCRDMLENIDYVKIKEGKNKIISYGKQVYIKNNHHICTIVPKSANEFSPTRDIGYILKRNTLEAIYEYKNIDGELRGVICRIIDKETSNKKLILINYGYDNIKDKIQEKGNWKIGNFKESNVIYKEEILKNSNKPVLIVEGEKVVEKASKIFKEYDVIL